MRIDDVEGFRKKQSQEQTKTVADVAAADAAGVKFMPEFLGGSELHVTRWGVKSGEPYNVEYSEIAVPTRAEVEEWKTALETVPQSGEADVAHQVDYTMRFCSLAYARNAPDAAQYMLLSSADGDGATDVIELQFHGTDTWFAGAHVVAYLYKLQKGGVGVVLAYKGSTLNIEDWSHNLNMFTLDGEKFLDIGVSLFDAEEAKDLAVGDAHFKEAQVMSGFKKYEDSLETRMRAFDMEQLKPTLAEWGVTVEAKDFYTWLHTDSWEWCVIVGHSLGGAMAKVSAVKIAGQSGHKPLLVTVGAPASGDHDNFQQALKNHVLPGGGLRVYHLQDPVPFSGYLESSVLNTWWLPKSEGLNVAMWPLSFDPIGLHLYYDVPTTEKGSEKPETHRFVFPSFKYDPSPQHDAENLRNYKVVSSGPKVSAIGRQGGVLGVLDRFVGAHSDDSAGLDPQWRDK